MLAFDAMSDQIARKVFVDGDARGERLWLDLEELQKRDPVYFLEEADLWIVTGYAEVRAVLGARGAKIAFAERNDRMSPGWREHRSRVNVEPWFGHQDGDAHFRVRRALNGYFMPSAIRGFGDILGSTIEQIVADFRLNGGGDFLEQVGFRLTEAVTDHLLGIGDVEKPDFRTIIPRIMKTFGFGISEKDWAEADEASDQMRAFWQGEIARRRKAGPGNDILGQVMRSGEFSDDELVVFGENVLAAATDTTAHTATNGMHLLLRNPDVISRIQGDQGLVPAAVEEVFRLVSAAPKSGRSMVESLEVNGRVLPKGAVVLAVLGAANRDPGVFDDPHTMRLDRENAGRSIAFGQGVHVCLGQWVARLGLVRLYSELARQCKTIRVDGDLPELDGIGLRQVDGLRVAVS